MTRPYYVAVRAYDSELSTLDRLIGRRDQFLGDMVGIAFDSYHDHRTAFEFDVSAGGSKVDLLIHPDGFDLTWNAVWEVEVGLEEDAWVAEFRIPLSQLRYADDVAVQVWGMHSFRWIRRTQEEINWQIIPRDNSGFVFSFGELQGLEGLRSPRRIEILPYALGRASTHEKEPLNPYRTGSDFDFEAGVSMQRSG